MKIFFFACYFIYMFVVGMWIVAFAEAVVGFEFDSAMGVVFECGNYIRDRGIV